MKRALFFLTLLGVSTLVHAADEALDALFETDPGSPGCMAGYSVGGVTQYLRGFGLANLEHNIPISEKTRFHIGSVSKEFTAAAIGLLILEGKLSLTDDVRPFFPNMPVFDHTITIEHLLQHTSGLANHTRLMPDHNLDYGNSLEQDKMLDIVFSAGLSAPPGTRFEYSSSYLLLGDIVEKISEMPLREFLRRRIFEPLGMRSSGLHDDFSIIPNRAEGYLKQDERWVNDRVRYSLIGSGGVHMTMSDLLLWNDALYNDKLSDGLTDLMFNTAPMQVMDNLSYHFGFFRSDYNGAPSTAHSGSYQGTKTLLYHIEPDLTTVIACNHRTDIQALNWAFIEAVQAQLADP